MNKDVLPPVDRQQPGWYFRSLHPASGQVVLLDNAPSPRVFAADIENRRPAVEAGGVFRGLALAPSRIGYRQFSFSDDGSLLAYAIESIDYLENSDAAASLAERELLNSSDSPLQDGASAARSEMPGHRGGGFELSI